MVPGKVENKFVKASGEKKVVALARGTGRLVDLEDGERVHGRRHVVQPKLVGRQLQHGEQICAGVKLRH